MTLDVQEENDEADREVAWIYNENRDAQRKLLTGTE